MHGVLFGSALVAAFFGGVVALLAPCCVSVMLPAYLASGSKHRGGVPAATGLFGAGVAAVILPIGMGAGALSAAIAGHHALVFGVGGAAMLLGGAAMLAGVGVRLPMPSGRMPSGSGAASTFGLGVFSGVASSCCAPVLAGVALLAGATASFWSALAVAAVYVAGMVAPLAAFALAWDKGATRTRAGRLLSGRRITLRLGPWRRDRPLGGLVSGVLLVAIGVLTLISAAEGPSMGLTGWRERFAAWLQHAAHGVTSSLGWLPGWVFASLLIAAFAGLVRAARRGGTAPPAAQPPDSCCATDDVVVAPDRTEPRFQAEGSRS